jgi:predicted RNA-binding protein associated with RNAse of E/G family
MGTTNHGDASPVPAEQSTLTVTLFHAGEPPYLEYAAEVLFDDGDHIVVRAKWAEATDRDVSYVRFEKGDTWTEHYWRGRWYAIKEIRDADGRLKGWYCDAARPAQIIGERLFSEDLFLDLWVSGDHVTVLRLDEDEFVASGLPVRDRDAADAARRALDELEFLASDGFGAVTA